MWTGLEPSETEGEIQSGAEAPLDQALDSESEVEAEGGQPWNEGDQVGQHQPLEGQEFFIPAAAAGEEPTEAEDIDSEETDEWAGEKTEGKEPLCLCYSDNWKAVPGNRPLDLGQGEQVSPLGAAPEEPTRPTGPVEEGEGSIGEQPEPLAEEQEVLTAEAAQDVREKQLEFMEIQIGPNKYQLFMDKTQEGEPFYYLKLRYGKDAQFTGGFLADQDGNLIDLQGDLLTSLE